MTKADDTSKLIIAYERYMDTALKCALVGDFNPELDTKAHAAFSMQDAAKLGKLTAKRERKGMPDFIEANDLFDTLDKPKITKGENKGKEREWTTAERYTILRDTPNTRAYARKLLDEHTDIPFS